MILQDVLYKVSIRSVKGDTSIAVNSIAIDSRLAKPGSCFIALKGTKSDGQAYIDAAIEKGATAIICESIPANATDGITYIEVENTAKAAGYISHNFFGEPSTRVKLVGVTGTNGKTTIATLLWKLFSGLGHTCGLISTVQNQVGDKVLEATHTTPDAVSINALLKQMVEAGCTHVFMECSSHAIHQYR
ncbi:MAG TPA: Mur ligase family protein, partial [Ferruginibacter sp.]|nr:Mur ligase family protein [Ferruginibacter sp.]